MWIDALSREGRWVIISGDRRITRNRAEYAAFRSSRLVGFFLFRGLYKAPVAKQTDRHLIGERLLRAGVKLHIMRTARESQIGTANPTAIDHLFRGLVLSDLPQTLDNLIEQEREFREALKLEPQNIEAMARLARSLCLQAWQFGPVLDPDIARAKLAEGKALADEALTSDPNNAFAHIPKGLALWAEGRYPELVDRL